MLVTVIVTLHSIKLGTKRRSSLQYDPPNASPNSELAQKRVFRANSFMAIRILATGGTFDKEYDELTGRLYFKDTHVAEMLRLGRSRVEVTIRTVMTDTAAAIARAISGKTIVLTGAMVPYAFGSSDGLFNLGSALSFAQILPAGVYIAMNGQSFSWDRVRKNRERGEFEEI